MKRKLAARAGCWSAQDRKAAILGWLVFVSAHLASATRSDRRTSR